MAIVFVAAVSLDPMTRMHALHTKIMLIRCTFCLHDSCIVTDAEWVLSDIHIFYAQNCPRFDIGYRITMMRVKRMRLVKQITNE